MSTVYYVTIAIIRVDRSRLCKNVGLQTLERVHDSVSVDSSIISAQENVHCIFLFWPRLQ